MVARAGHRDLQWCATVTAHLLAARWTLARRAADERPVLAVRPLEVLAAAYELAGVGVHDEGEPGGPQPHGDRVVVLGARDLREPLARDPHVRELVAQALALVGVDPVLQVVEQTVGDEAADRLELVLRPRRVEPAVDHLDALDARIARQARIVRDELRPARV